MKKRTEIRKEIAEIRRKTKNYPDFFHNEYNKISEYVDAYKNLKEIERKYHDNISAKWDKLKHREKELENLLLQNKIEYPEHINKILKKYSNGGKIRIIHTIDKTFRFVIFSIKGHTWRIGVMQFYAKPIHVLVDTNYFDFTKSMYDNKIKEKEFEGRFTKDNKIECLEFINKQKTN